MSPTPTVVLATCCVTALVVLCTWQYRRMHNLVENLAGLAGPCVMYKVRSITYRSVQPTADIAQTKTVRAYVFEPNGTRAFCLVPVHRYAVNGEIDMALLAWIPRSDISMRYEEYAAPGHNRPKMFRLYLCEHRVPVQANVAVGAVCPGVDWFGHVFVFRCSKDSRHRLVNMRIEDEAPSQVVIRQYALYDVSLVQCILTFL